MNDVGLIGPLNVDLLISGAAPVDREELTRWSAPSDVTLCAAGSAGYIAQDLAKFRLKTSVVSILADDPFGDALSRILADAGLDTSRIARQADTLSGIGIYMLLFGSKKRPLTYRLPTHLPWPQPFSEDHKTFLLENHRHLHCAGYLHFPSMWNKEMADLFRKAKSKGLSTSLDPQFVLFPIETPWLVPIRGMLAFVDMLLLDEDEACKITGQNDLKEAARRLQTLGPATVVVKQGARGSILVQGDTTTSLDAVMVPEEEISDAIGAGDAFDAGMIYGFLNGWPPNESQKFATHAASSTLKGPGGTASLAAVEEIIKQMK